MKILGLLGFDLKSPVDRCVVDWKESLDIDPFNIAYEGSYGRR